MMCCQSCKASQLLHLNKTKKSAQQRIVQLLVIELRKGNKAKFIAARFANWPGRGCCSTVVVQQFTNSYESRQADE